MIWARCSTRVRLGRARFTSGRARCTSDRARCTLGRARCSLARCPVERPRWIRVSGSGFRGASAGARGPTRGVASRGGWRTRDGERDDATRRGTGRGRGPGGLGRSSGSEGDAGGERGGGFDRSKYVVPPVPTYEERVARRTRGGRRDGDERGGPIDASAPKHARVARGGRMMNTHLPEYPPPRDDVNTHLPRSMCHLPVMRRGDVRTS